MEDEPQHPKIIDWEAKLEDKVVPEILKYKQKNDQSFQNLKIFKSLRRLLRFQKKI